MSTKDVVISHSLLGLEYRELIFASPEAAWIPEALETANSLLLLGSPPCDWDVVPFGDCHGPCGRGCLSAQGLCHSERGSLPGLARAPALCT